YQAAVALETIAKMHPRDPKSVASRVRKFALVKKRHWVVIQRALECISAYPYLAKNALALAMEHVKNKHSMVRRAALALLTRGPKHEVRNQMNKLIYHADPTVSRLALYFQRLIRDKDFGREELARMRHGSGKDFVFQLSLSRLYSLAATENREVAANLNAYIAGLPPTKSQKIAWHRMQLRDRSAWSIQPRPTQPSDAEPTPA
ncbi:MAG: hypothetical protein KIT69_16640, partial [Propionibacteriaceae bacterium]|nr:hypothetical protein [Propionibacteriaceae bacterium]